MSPESKATAPTIMQAINSQSGSRVASVGRTVSSSVPAKNSRSVRRLVWALSLNSLAKLANHLYTTAQRTKRAKMMRESLMLRWDVQMSQPKLDSRPNSYSWKFVRIRVPHFSSGRALFLPEDDAAFGQVVGAEFDFDSVAGEDADEMLAHFTADDSEDLAIAGAVELELEHCVGQCEGNNRFYFNRFRFSHNPNSAMNFRVRLCCLSEPCIIGPSGESNKEAGAGMLHRATKRYSF
jgi:hypothetical protein